MIEFYIDSRETARRAGTGRRQLRRWLRAEKEAGNPLLADHDKGARYWFLPADADVLAAQYRSSHP
jgi:hypothetical protein